MLKTILIDILVLAEMACGLAGFYLLGKNAGDIAWILICIFCSVWCAEMGYILRRK